jgi:hypothetical protein
MTTVGRWSPNKVRARVLDGTWVSTEELGGMVLLTPTSIAYTGTSASIGASGSVEFTACSSLSLNGVFSADYDNYMIGWRATQSVAAAGRIRLSAGGVDDTTASSYTRQLLNANNTSVNASRSSSDYFNSVVSFPGSTTYFFGPYLAQPTAVRTVSSSDTSGAYIIDAAFTHNQSTSYDGFTIYPFSGDFTGLISVYGLVGA